MYQLSLLNSFGRSFPDLPFAAVVRCEFGDTAIILGHVIKQRLKFLAFRYLKYFRGPRSIPNDISRGAPFQIIYNLSNVFPEANYLSSE